MTLLRLAAKGNAFVRKFELKAFEGYIDRQAFKADGDQVVSRSLSREAADTRTSPGPADRLPLPEQTITFDPLTDRSSNRNR
ncbi:MAG: hypothetical protein K2Z81_02175, partial [Cyanobacteria bacterium]|nr:hypothetical protein [Cyanobacteriota bacterium]